jgi:hypothetical protein
MTARLRTTHPLAVSRQFRLAPWLREPSGMLRFLAFYFTLTGSCALGLAIFALVFKSAGGSMPWHPASIAIYGMNAAGLAWIGTQLRSRSLSSWYCACLAVVAPLLASASGHGWLTQGIFAVVSLGLLLAVRKEFE